MLPYASHGMIDVANALPDRLRATNASSSSFPVTPFGWDVRFGGAYSMSASDSSWLGSTVPPPPGGPMRSNDIGSNSEWQPMHIAACAARYSPRSIDGSAGGGTWRGGGAARGVNDSRCAKSLPIAYHSPARTSFRTGSSERRYDIAATRSSSESSPTE